MLLVLLLVPAGMNIMAAEPEAVPEPPEIPPAMVDGEAIELKQIYVLASEFGTGLGKRLLDEVFRCARRKKKSWVWLSVSDLNTRARSFYRKNGFRALGAAPVLEVGSDRLPATVMAIKLY